MEDKMAMEGTLARCNEDRQGTINDLECANARRAASAIALVIERDRRETLERESERKLAALRVELEMRERAAREAMAAAEAARQAAYEAQWRSSTGTPTDVLSDPTGAANSEGAAETIVAGEAPPGTATSTAPAPDAAAQIPRPFRESESTPGAE